MNWVMFSVLDKPARVFIRPWCVRHEAEAIRSFYETAVDSAHQFAKHPEDFVLYELGTFDDGSGLVHPIGGEVRRVCSAAELLGRVEARGAGGEQRSLFEEEK